MALVDYSSSDASSSDHDAGAQHQQPPSKKRKTTNSTVHAVPPSHSPSPSSNPPTTAARSALPPLPASFHNLYAHTTRPSTTDNPALHQGRRRVIPHVEGNWPSHIAVEWHPDPATHGVLASLLDALADELAPLLAAAAADDGAELTSFLASDLGAPLPLHISLSRPFVLRTEEKEGFLERALRGVAGGGGEGFELRVDGLGWFRSREGGRSFLVLRVRSSSSAGGGDKVKGRNPELAALLAQCNELVAAYGQPRLYARTSVGEGAENGNGSASDRDNDDDGGVQSVGDGEDGDGGGVDDAFHVSIAWSFAVPSPHIRARTAAVFARQEFQNGIVEDIRIPVRDVKVKIGNVVTCIPLEGRKSGGGGLFGI